MGKVAWLLTWKPQGSEANSKVAKGTVLQVSWHSIRSSPLTGEAVSLVSAWVLDIRLLSDGRVPLRQISEALQASVALSLKWGLYRDAHMVSTRGHPVHVQGMTPGEMHT